MSAILGQVSCFECPPQDTVAVVEGDEVSLPCNLQDVIERKPDGVLTLRCGHQRVAWLRVSAQEWMRD